MTDHQVYFSFLKLRCMRMLICAEERGKEVRGRKEGFEEKGSLVEHCDARRLECSAEKLRWRRSHSWDASRWPWQRAPASPLLRAPRNEGQRTKGRRLSSWSCP